MSLFLKSPPVFLMPAAFVFLTGSGNGLDEALPEVFNVEPDNTPSAEPFPLFVTAFPQVLHSPVHFPLVVQLTEPLPVVHEKPSSELRNCPPALPQLAIRLVWEMPLRETLPAKTGVAKKISAVVMLKSSGANAVVRMSDIRRCIFLSREIDAMNLLFVMMIFGTSHITFIEVAWFLDADGVFVLNRLCNRFRWR